MIHECSVVRWLEANEPKYHEALSKACATALLSPRNNKGGATIIIPDAKVVATMSKLAEGPAADKEQVKALARNHILVGAIKDTSKVGKSVTSLGGKTMLVDKIEKTVVTVAGIKLTEHKKWADGTVHNDVAIFSADKALPEGKTGGKQPKMEYEFRNHRNSKSKSGGAMQIIPDADTDLVFRAKLVSNIVREFMSVITARLTMPSFNIDPIKVGGAPGRRNYAIKEGAYRNVLYERLLSLIKYIQDNDKKCFDESVVPNLSWEVADLFILIEGVKKGAKYLVPTELLRSWYKSQPGYNYADYCVELDGIVNTHATKDNKNPLSVYAAVDAKRGEIYGKGSGSNIISDYPAAAKWAQKVYKEMAVAAGCDNPTRKLVEDELRFLTQVTFQSVFNNLADSGVSQKLHTIFGVLYSYLEMGASNMHPIIMNESVLGAAFQTVESRDHAYLFVSSWYFWFVPISESTRNALCTATGTSASYYECLHGDVLFAPQSFKQLLSCLESKNANKHKELDELFATIIKSGSGIDNSVKNRFHSLIE